MTRYAGKQYNAAVSPIDDLPYFIITMEDRSFLSVRDINNFCFSFFMLFGFFFFLAAILLVVFIVSYKKRYYSKEYFDVSWIGPNKRFHTQYNIAAAGNISGIVLLISLYGHVTFLQYLFMLLNAATMTVFFLQYLYMKFYASELAAINAVIAQPRGKIVSIEEVSGNIIGIDEVPRNLIDITDDYIKNDGTDDAAVLKKQKCYALIALGIIMLAVNTYTYHYTEGNPVLFFELGFIVILFGVEQLYTFCDTRGWLKALSTWDFSTSFSLMTFTRLIVTSGLPVVLFYISASTYEIKLVTRYRHSMFLKSILQDPGLSLDSLSFTKIYTDGVWINTAKLLKENPKPPYIKDNANTTLLFKNLMLDNQGLFAGLKEFDHNAGDGSWIYSSIFTPGRGVSYYHYRDNNYFHIESASIVYNNPDPTDKKNGFTGCVYWIVFIGALAGFWYVLHHILRKLFALNLTSEAYWDDIDKMLLTNNKLNSLVFLIGPPGSGKLATVLDLVKNKHIKEKSREKGKEEEQPEVRYDGEGSVNDTLFIADMILIPNDPNATDNAGWNNILAQVKDSRYKLVIINHFEYDIKNTVANNTKLNFLEGLLQQDSCKLIILSTVHPVNFLDSLNRQQGNLPEGQRPPEHILERWHVLLGHFNIAIDRLDDTFETNDQEKNNVDKGANNCKAGLLAWEKTIIFETNNGHFLNRLQAPVMELLKGKIPAPDGVSLSVKLGITSHYFYMYMWQSLTKEEKFLLYDLAEDGLVNPYDDYNLTLLISKGLIKRDENILRIFNHGFRNFILTAIGSTEAALIQEQIKDTGNWNKLKTPITLLIVAVLAFLFTSQKETYATLFEYVTIIGAGVPALLKIFSLFGSSTKDGK